MNASTSTAAIIRVAGGVAETTVRYASEKVTGKKPESVVFGQFRAFTEFETVEIPMVEINIRFAVCRMQCCSL